MAKPLDHYIDQARHMKLHDMRYWNLLLHMNDDGISEIDDPAFFLAPEGKANAEKELEATLTALYQENRFDDNATACQYPARKAWLQEQLHLEGLPEVSCQQYNEMIRRVDPQSASLVFPYAHINSPASMFGHTFLRIDSSYASKLLSHAVNYTANVDQNKENGVAFAIKGLFGGYPGHFSMLPYYEKLKEYRDTEQRDVWEYDLNLERTEMMRMMRHIWELRDTYAWYYFFDENCSYNILWLIEVARPSVHLREYFFYQVLPAETVFAVEAEGLVNTKQYRPSKRTRLLAYEEALGASGSKRAMAVALGYETPDAIVQDKVLKSQQKQFILEAASELAEYRYIENTLDKEDYLTRFHGILGARAALGQGRSITVSQPLNPDQGHRANRLYVENGWRNGIPEQRLGYRPAFHSTDESDVGYLRGTQIEFMSLVLVKNPQRVELDELTLLSLTSLAKRSHFIRPLSWRMKAAVNRDFITEDRVGTLHVGGGGSWETPLGYAYLMVDPQLFVHDNETTVALGGSVGMLLFGGDAHQGTLDWTRRMYEGVEHQSIFTVNYNLRIDQNIALGIRGAYREQLGDDRRDLALFAKVYF